MFSKPPSSLSSLPAAVADLVRRMASPSADPAAADLLARACEEAVRAITRGDVCLPLSRLADHTPADLRREDASTDDDEVSATDTPSSFRYPSLPDLCAALLAFPTIVAASPTKTFAPFILDRDRLYTRRNHTCERRIRERLDALASTPAPPIPFDPTDPILADLTPEQRDAIKTLLSHRFAILTGGPGTGKTHVLARAVRLALRALPDLRILLAAPTGKAAARMGESFAASFAEGAAADVLMPPASTLQKLIGQNPATGTFRHHAGSPLSVDWLVIDEASMVDLLLFGHVLDALPPTARLLLIGDPHQLASVERGRILRDLCDATAPGTRELAPIGCNTPRYPIAHLSTSHRFPPDGPIARFAAAVNSGDAPSALSVLQSPDSASPLAWTPHPADSARGPDAWPGFRAAVLTGYSALARAATPVEALVHVNDCRILCAVRRGPYGVDRANAAIRAWLPASPMPVMIVHNDPALGVNNGDLGIIFSDAPDTVWLPALAPSSPPRSIPRLLLPDLAPAWATTVHKSQGSEYATVAIVLPDDPDCPLLTREILYTAVTRTTGTVRLWCSESSLRTCILRPVVRASGFSA